MTITLEVEPRIQQKGKDQDPVDKESPSDQRLLLASNWKMDWLQHSKEATLHLVWDFTVVLRESYTTPKKNEGKKVKLAVPRYHKVDENGVSATFWGSALQMNVGAGFYGQYFIMLLWPMWSDLLFQETKKQVILYH